jgi:hypothetical protein
MLTSPEYCGCNGLTATFLTFLSKHKRNDKSISARHLVGGCDRGEYLLRMRFGLISLSTSPSKMLEAATVSEQLG